MPIYHDDCGRPFHHTEPPSVELQPFKLMYTREGKPPVEQYENDLYEVSVRRYDKGLMPYSAAYCLLGINRIDQTAHHDWRDFQQIKNMLVGDEWVGIELYPAESQLVDPSNQFFMYVVPKSCVGWGLQGGRNVVTAKDSRAPQRPFPHEREEEPPCGST